MILRQKTKQISVSAVKIKIETQPDFLPSFLTSREIRYCKSKRHFAEPAAVRIAAKQACLNLFQIPPKQWAKWMLDLEVCKQKNGVPFLKLSQNLRRKTSLSRKQVLMLSLAHERELAIAWIALVKTGKNAA